MDDISFSKRRKNRGYTYRCAGSVICVSLPRAPQYSTFACCLIPVLTLVVLLVMLDDIDDISFSKRRYFLIVSWMSISVYCIPTRDTHITRDMCMGIYISRGYTYHCDTGTFEKWAPGRNADWLSQTPEVESALSPWLNSRMIRRPRREGSILLSFVVVLWSYGRKICLDMCHGNSENSYGCSYLLTICFSYGTNVGVSRS